MDEHGEAVFTRGAVTLALAGTTFTVDDDLYDANSESDRDKDGIACEKR